MKENKEKSKKSKHRVNRFIILLVFILTLIASVFAIYNIFLLESIEDLIRYVVMGVFIIIDLLLILRIRRIWRGRVKKESKHVFLILFMIFYMLINLAIGGVIFYLYGTVSGINKKWVTYSSSLVVMGDNEATKINDIKDYNIGILDDKKSPEGYIIPQEVIKKHHLKENNKIKQYDTYTEMLSGLYNGDLDAIFLSSDYVSLYSSIEEYAHINNDTRVILKQEKKMLKSSTSKRETGSTGKSVKEPFTILLMGIDSTDEGLAKNAVANGDSLVLVTFNPKTLNATMLSIPRDSYVPISCFTGKYENKITHAAWHGTDCMMETIEDYFGINIDYYAKVNFKGLVHLVDAIGGIDVTVPADLCTDDSSRGQQVCIQEGYQHLDGEGALVLSRNRKQLANGDLGRGQNQQLVIQAMLNKMKTITSISQFTDILNTVSYNLDTNLSTQQILSFYNIGKDILARSFSTDDSDIVSIQQLFLQGDGQMIYDENMKMVLWNYIPNKDSKKDIISAMRQNLELEDHEVIKEFSFSINEPYEKEIIGYGPYKTSYKYDLLPDFTGDSRSAASSWASKNGVRVTFNGGNGYVIRQSQPANKRIDKISGSVVLTLGGSTSSNTTTTDKTKEKNKDKNSNSQSGTVKVPADNNNNNDDDKNSDTSSEEQSPPNKEPSEEIDDENNNKVPTE